MKTALVTGGTGQIGVFLLPRLLEAGWRIVAPTHRVHVGETRSPEAGDGRLHWIHPDDFPKGDVLAERGPGTVDVLISVGPLELAASLAAKCENLERVVCISSSSVLVKSDSPVAWEREEMRALLAAEDALRETCKARTIPLWLFRPTLIYGCGLDRNVSLMAHLAQRFRILPVAGKAEGLRQPVHAEDLAWLACRAVTRESGPGLESPVAGGESLTYGDMVTRVLEASGMRSARRTLLLPVPTFLLAAGAGLLGRLFGMHNLNAAMVRRQNRDLVFDDGPVRERLGWDPRPFRPTAADFQVPADTRPLMP